MLPWFVFFAASLYPSDFLACLLTYLPVIVTLSHIQAWSLGTDYDLFKALLPEPRTKASSGQ